MTCDPPVTEGPEIYKAISDRLGQMEDRLLSASFANCKHPWECDLAIANLKRIKYQLQQKNKRSKAEDRIPAKRNVKRAGAKRRTAGSSVAKACKKKRSRKPATACLGAEDADVTGVGNHCGIAPTTTSPLTHAATPSVALRFPLASSVILCGLRDELFNGMHGRIVDFDEERSRLIVEIKGLEGLRNIKPENLKLVMPKRCSRETKHLPVPSESSEKFTL